MANFRSQAQQEKEIENFINNLSDFEVHDQDDTYDEGIKIDFCLIFLPFPYNFCNFSTNFPWFHFMREFFFTFALLMRIIQLKTYP